MTRPEPMAIGESPAYPCVWRWRVRLPERKSQRCRITARGALNSVRVEFPDGFWVITSRWAVRLTALTPMDRQSRRRPSPAARRSNELRSRA
jgi:hypothetical protein